MASDPKIPEHELTPQGRIIGRAVNTEEKLQDVAPEFKGSGATPQEKADETKSWISKDHIDDRNRDESSRPHPDTYAQELNKRLGPLISVMDTLADGFERAKKSTVGEAAVEDRKLQMAEMAEKGHHDASAIAEKETGVGHKLLAAGGDDVMKILSDGASTQEDPLKANMRVSTEMLS